MKTNTEIVQDIYAAFGAGDLPAILEVQADEVVWTLPGAPDVPYGGEYHGKDGVAKFFQNLLSVAAFDAFAVQEFIAERQFVMVTGTETVRCLESGRSAENAWVMCWTLNDGKVVRMISYEDTAALATILHSPKE
jgi:ketosteroid isomerase-like protein